MTDLDDIEALRESKEWRMHLVTANVVVAARNFNPTILSQMWLVRNGVVAEDEFLSGCLFADGISQVETPHLILVALPDRLQISPRSPSDHKTVQNAVTKIIAALPHTPYTALGLNCVWHHTPDEGTIEQYTRRLFVHSNQSPYNVFDSNDAQFGAYFSKQFGKLRLRLDIKPVKIERPDGETEQLLQFSYNFHQDLRTEAVAEIYDTLDRWEETLELASRITQDTVKAQS